MNVGLPDFARRRERLLRELRARKAKNLLVTCPYNVTYLTGFKGEDSFLFISGDTTFLLSDGRYDEQIRDECPDLPLVLRPSNMPIIDAAARELQLHGLSTVWVESLSTSLAQWERLTELMPSGSLATLRGVVERLREKKDAYELAAIERAIGMAERSFQSVRAMLHADQTELDVSHDIESGIRRLGGSGAAFKTIVGVGPRSALPHGRPTAMRMAESSFVLVDWGAKEEQYLSDLTRVVVTGRAPAKLEKIYRVVLEAQQAAIQAIRPGVLMSEIDATARGVIHRAGYGNCFTHGLGHSFGLQIHETVRLAAGQDRPLEVDMVLTVEPGIYIPGFGGVRIEDDILVTKGGHRVLSTLGKDWDWARGQA
ncbi:MAG: aminopeptidase P family protein [Pirellula sp.]